MCTAFIHKGKHLICGFNMDINEGAMDYRVFSEPGRFYIGVDLRHAAMTASGSDWPAYYRVDNQVRKIMGVNREGLFAVCLNNMNCLKAPFHPGGEAFAIDQLMDDCISGRITVEEARRIAHEKELVNLPTGSVDIPSLAFHGFITSPESPILLVEPGNGYAVLQDRWAAMTNYALLEPPADLTPETYGYYGKDRMDTAMAILRQRDSLFTREDGLEILQRTKQTGTWATRVSFVYHSGENAVYYCLQGDFDRIRRHSFE